MLLAGANGEAAPQEQQPSTADQQDNSHPPGSLPSRTAPCQRNALKRVIVFFPVDFIGGFHTLRLMKTLLAIVLSFVISEAPVLALQGGYSLGGAAGTIGTYAGVMIPTSIQNYNVSVTGTSTTVTSSFGLNSLGLFTFDVPAVGFGSGTIIVFATDQEEDGTITTLPDPSNSDGIYGLIAATGEVATETYSDTFFGYSASLSEVTGQASGEMRVSTANSTNSVSANGINLSGTANVAFSVAVTNGSTGVNEGFVESQAVSYVVDGFQQSATAVASTGT